MNTPAALELALLQRLRSAGLQATRQRLAVAAAMFTRPVHLTAGQVLAALRTGAPAATPAGASAVSRATVYATLAQFASAGLLRELHTGTGAVVYDSQLSPHQHWVDVDTGQVHDLPAGVRLQVTGIDTLPSELQVQEVQVLLRVRRARA